MGGARSALQNWLYAKQHQGTLVLRIEDTDAARNSPEWIDGIISALAWIGLGPDTYEGPYLQSDYAGEHQAAAGRLYEAGRAYYCDCTRRARAVSTPVTTGTAGTARCHRARDGRCASAPPTRARPGSSTWSAASPPSRTG